MGVAVFLVLKYALWEKHDDTTNEAKEFKKDFDKKMNHIVDSNGSATDAVNKIEKLQVNGNSKSAPLDVKQDLPTANEEKTEKEEKPTFFIDTNTDEDSDADSKSEEERNDAKMQSREKTLEECLEILNDNEVSVKKCEYYLQFLYLKLATFITEILRAVN